MTVLEVDQPLAAPPPAEARQPWHQRNVRGETASGDGSQTAVPHGHELAEQAAERLASAHVPPGAAAGPTIPIEVRYAGRAGQQSVRASGRMYALEVADESFAAMLAIADPVVLLVTGNAGHGVVHWALVPGGPSVTARADALRLLRVMRADGALELRPTGLPAAPALQLDGGDWSRDDEVEWQLFENLATLEEWSGRTIPMPAELDGDAVARVVQAAVWARTERVDATLTGPLVFTVPGAPGLSGVDELRVSQDFGVSIGELDVPLGTGELHVRVEVLDVQGPDPQGAVSVAARPLQQDVAFVLRAPPGRRFPAVRTQPVDPHPGHPDALAGEAVPPEITVRATRRLAGVLDGVAARRATAAISTSALLDDLRADTT